MPRIHSIDKKRQAVLLRSKEGQSLRNIAKKLNISLSTAQLWTKGITLSKEQELKIATERTRKLIHGQKQYLKRTKAQKYQRESDIFSIAENEVDSKKLDSFFIMGLALYWAEGFKKDYSLGFVNSDPIMIQIFLEWLRKYGECNPADVRLRVQIHEIYKPHIHSIQLYWSELLHIPITQFQKPFYQISKSQATFDPNYKGLLRIRVIGTRNLFLRILGWLEGLKKITFTSSS